MLEKTGKDTLAPAGREPAQRDWYRWNRVPLATTPRLIGPPMPAARKKGECLTKFLAKDGVFFRRMAVIHPKWRTPAFSLIGQGIWAAVLTLSGRYDQLYTYVIFGMVLSYTLTVIGLFVLRWKKPDVPRSYRCTGYPWLPAIYVIVGVAWTLNTIIERPNEALWGAIIVLVGVPGYLYWKRRSHRIDAPE